MQSPDPLLYIDFLLTETFQICGEVFNILVVKVCRFGRKPALHFSNDVIIMEMFPPPYEIFQNTFFAFHMLFVEKCQQLRKFPSSHRLSGYVGAI